MCVCVCFTEYIIASAHWPNAYSARQWSGRPEFNPWSYHTKDFKNGT